MRCGNFVGMDFEVATIQPEDLDPVGVGEPLSGRQERFAIALAQLDNPSEAYRRAFNPGARCLPSSIRIAGRALACIPAIQARVRELRSAVAAGTILDLRELAQMYYDIATADPNEIMAWVHTCCRHCYGAGHAFQWKSEEEFTAEYMRVSDALAQAQETGKPTRGLRLPTFEGGVGFDQRRDPVLTCPECCGKGVQGQEVADTTKLTGKAQRLYKGLRIKKDSIEVLMHDQDGAREALGRMMGAFKDADPRKLNGTDIEGEAERLPDSISAEDAARAYLEVMG